MSAGRGEQIERELTAKLIATGRKPWGHPHNSHKKNKAIKHRRERRRAKKDPEAEPEYRKYTGYEW